MLIIEASIPNPFGNENDCCRGISKCRSGKNETFASGASFWPSGSVLDEGDLRQIAWCKFVLCLFQLTKHLEAKARQTLAQLLYSTYRSSRVEIEEGGDEFNDTLRGCLQGTGFER